MSTEHDCASSGCETGRGAEQGGSTVCTIRHESNTLACGHLDQALALGTSRMNDAVHNHVVTLATRCGSTTKPGAFHLNYANTTAKAVGLAKADAKVIAALPPVERAILSLLRDGVATRAPRWAAQGEAEGGTKPYNRVRKLAAEWAATEALALHACGIEDVVGQAEALLALEVLS